MSKSRRYKVCLARDEGGWWVATVAGLPGVATQGRTLVQARERIEEALSAATGLDGPVETDEQVVLAPDLGERLREAQTARATAERLHREAQDAARSAVFEFARRGVSTRDAGYLLNMSHQRVHQLLSTRRSDRQAEWKVRPGAKGRKQR